MGPLGRWVPGVQHRAGASGWDEKPPRPVQLPACRWRGTGPSVGLACPSLWGWPFGLAEGNWNLAPSTQPCAAATPAGWPQADRVLWASERGAPSWCPVFPATQEIPAGPWLSQSGSWSLLYSQKDTALSPMGGPGQGERTGVVNGASGQGSGLLGACGAGLSGPWGSERALGHPVAPLFCP